MKSAIVGWSTLILLACLGAQPAKAQGEPYGSVVWLQLTPGPIAYAAGGAETYIDPATYYYYYAFGIILKPVVEGQWFENGGLIDLATNDYSEGLTADVSFTG